ncbi:MAG: hypothetical protein K6U09_09990 [Acidobacteriia bacterium]|jgi:hypothetical protein|nr:hypothetical protein [Terriglobia bacterium]
MIQHFLNKTKVSREVSHLLANDPWPVAGSYHIETQTRQRQRIRVVVPDWRAPGADACWPVLEPRLVEDFGAVRDEASLLAFTKRYGLLGYEEARRSGEGLNGDPVGWALGHARIIEGGLGILGIISDVRSGRVKLDDHSSLALARAIEAQFKKMGLRGPVEEPMLPKLHVVKLPPEVLPDKDDLAFSIGFRDWECDPIGCAYTVLTTLINDQIKAINYKFQSFHRVTPEAEHKFGLELHWNALLHVVYWRFAERLGGEFRQCGHCGRVFPMRTGRDRYCSPSCLNVIKCRNYRARKRQKREKDGGNGEHGNGGCPRNPQAGQSQDSK